jgi:hypothetical protein
MINEVGLTLINYDHYTLMEKWCNDEIGRRAPVGSEISYIYKWHSIYYGPRA